MELNGGWLVTKLKRETSSVVGVVPHDFELGQWEGGSNPSEPILLLGDCAPQIASSAVASHCGSDADQTHIYLMQL